MNADESLEQISDTLRIAAIAPDEMRECSPAFDAIPFAEALAQYFGAEPDPLTLTKLKRR